jgi:hypothetical protein
MFCHVRRGTRWFGTGPQLFIDAAAQNFNGPGKGLKGTGREKPGRYFTGIGWLAGTGTALTLFFGLPEATRSPYVR